VDERGRADRRVGWERQWRGRPDAEFTWSLAEAPPQLRDLVEAGGLGSGAAVDLGCGAGTATAYLAGHFSPAVGLDLAEAAVRQARAAAVEPRPAFAVADAARLPLATGRLAFAFDRGCLQNLPGSRWAAYFAEVERVLAPGGVLQVLVSRAVPEFAPLTTVPGLARRWQWYVRRRRPGPQFLSHDHLRRLCPAGLEVTAMEDFPFRTRDGRARRFTHARYRRR